MALVAQVAQFGAGAAEVSQGTSSEEVVALQGVLAWVRVGAWKVVAWVQGVAAWRPVLSELAGGESSVLLLPVEQGVVARAGLLKVHCSLLPGQRVAEAEPAATAAS